MTDYSSGMTNEDVRAIAYQTVGLLLLILGVISAVAGTVLLIYGHQDCAYHGNTCGVRNELLKSQGATYILIGTVLLLVSLALKSSVFSVIKPRVHDSES